MHRLIHAQEHFQSGDFQRNRQEKSAVKSLVDEIHNKCHPGHRCRPMARILMVKMMMVEIVVAIVVYVGIVYSDRSSSLACDCIFERAGK